jgi:hypothetical protein
VTPDLALNAGEMPGAATPVVQADGCPICLGRLDRNQRGDDCACQWPICGHWYHVSCLAETRVLSRDMACGVCRAQTWQAHHDAELYALCEREGVQWPSPQVVRDTTNPRLVQPPRPHYGHMHPLCCRRIICPNGLDPMRHENWIELWDRDMVFTPAWRQEAWNDEWQCVRCNAVMREDQFAAGNVVGVCLTHGDQVVFVDLHAGTLQRCCVDMTGNAIACESNQAPFRAHALDGLSPHGPGAPTQPASQSMQAQALAANNLPVNDWRGRGPPARPWAQPSNSDLFVPMILNACGLLQPLVREAWLQDAVAGRWWPAVEAALSDRPPIDPWQFHAIVIQLCAARLQEAQGSDNVARLQGALRTNVMDTTAAERFANAVRGLPAGTTVHLHFAVRHLAMEIFTFQLAARKHF